MVLQKEQELIERNKVQKKIYITPDNIDILFGENDTEPLSYYFILNLLRQKITMFFGKTQDFNQKEELAYNCLAKIYSSFRKKLAALEEQKKTDPNVKVELFFYISQFYCYLEKTARNEIIFYKTKKKISVLEFREGVDYTQPLEEYVGHPIYDTDNLIPEEWNNEDNDETDLKQEESTQEAEEVEQEEIEENSVKKKIEKKVLSQKHLEKIHYEKSLMEKENEIQLQCLLNNIHFLTSEEIKLIKGIYNNEEKKDIFLTDVFTELIEQFNTETLQKEIMKKKKKKNVCRIIEELSKKKFNTVLEGLQSKINLIPDLKEKLIEMMGL